MNTKTTRFLIRTIILFLLASPICTAIRAQTVSFNFTAAATSVSGWTNVAGDPTLAVATVTDPATGISISSIATANWHPYNSGGSYDGLGATNGTFFPAAVLLNHWFQYDGSVSTYNPAAPQFKVSGLKQGRFYTLRMAGSSTSSLNSNPTRYTIAGSTDYGYRDVNSHNNTADGAVFNHIAPDGTGAITIYVNTISTTDVGDISGLQIIAEPSYWSATGNAGLDPATQFIGTTDTQPLAFRTNSVERFRVDAVGNVGIGTANPSSKLAVNGTITAKIVKVTPNGWSDYVFDSTYHLPLLQEVDKYIKANKHLPDIISAPEVSQNGLDLGSNQAALLKKIEELTLYMIQQDEALKKVNNQLSSLQKQIKTLKKMKTRK